jgi:hypothetical protein
MERSRLSTWIDLYEQAWRSPGTDWLSYLFTPDATYSKEPFAEPIRGLDAIAKMWEAEREGPDEVFRMTSEIVAVDGDSGVVRVDVTYGEPVRTHYRDLWIVRLDADGRCVDFEEWPFWPDKGYQAHSGAGGAG